MKKLTPLGAKRARRTIDRRFKELGEIRQELSIALKVLQSRCPHASTVKHRDSSGGSDSVIECLDCGKEW